MHTPSSRVCYRQVQFLHVHCNPPSSNLSASEKLTRQLLPVLQRLHPHVELLVTFLLFPIS
jgi:hypothetical protein